MGWKAVTLLRCKCHPLFDTLVTNEARQDWSFDLPFFWSRQLAKTTRGVQELSGRKEEIQGNDLKFFITGNEKANSSELKWLILKIFISTSASMKNSKTNYLALNGIIPYV